jgi:TPP-dependent pyruvate/acetoin dehydrogenase alpha subunit
MNGSGNKDRTPKGTRMYERLYRALYRIRRVEEEIAAVYPTDKIKSPVHLSIGQEWIAVGVCEALRPDDVVFGSYRSHAYYLAKGGDLKKMFAELYGKATGCAKGKGGSMHLIDAAHGVMGASAVVGTTIPNAVGYAYAMKLQKKNRLVVSFFGDGATEEGVFHESLNFAALKQLPVIFVCENNFYAIHTHILRRQKSANLCAKAKAHDMPAEQIDDGDPVQLYGRVREVAELMRAGRSGPYFFECLTYRWKEHVGPNEDFHLGYRSLEEARPWLESDAVRRAESLLDSGVCSRIRAEVEDEIQAAMAFAEESPFPDPRELFTDVVGG